MLRFVLFVVGLVVAANLVSGWAVDFLLRRMAVGDEWRWGLGAFFVVQSLGLLAVIGGRALGHQPGTGLGRPLLSFFMIWDMLLSLPAAVIYAAWAVIAWLSGSAGSLPGLCFLPGLSVMGTVVALWQLQRFRINRLIVTVPGLPAALSGLSIVHLSDLHIGKLTRGKVLDDMVASTNQLEPDLILVTGDIINMSLDDLPGALDLMRGLKSRYGLFLCEGNHDLIEDEVAFETAVKASGLAFLLNESAAVMVKGQPVRILGLRWNEGMRGRNKQASKKADPAFDSLLAQRAPGDFTIMLAHHPDAFDAAAAAGIPLTLAGHTHGGQLMLTSKVGFGPWLYRYWSGLYAKGASRLIVSNGAGNWFPLRINAPAEIIYIVLQAA